MAEALIYARQSHWFDEETIAISNQSTGYEYNREKILNNPFLGVIEKAKYLSNLEDKYNAKFVKGDFVEVRKNRGFATEENPTGAGWRKDVFALLIIEDAGYSDLKKKQTPYYYDEKRIMYKSRYKLDGNFTAGDIIKVKILTDVTIIDKVE